jgi:hypothetical protein
VWKRDIIISKFGLSLCLSTSRLGFTWNVLQMVHCTSVVFEEASPVTWSTDVTHVKRNASKTGYII